ncbi:MAG TPA: ABC transporter ATP-binding protein [Cytophagales bacterium]|nr:ABC transporter ATP-binding protein [Cytophagales bacterium]
MKTYFRVISTIKPFARYAVPFLIFTILSVIFYLLTFYMLVPMLDIIFIQYKENIQVEKPVFELTKEYANKLSLYYYAQIRQSGFLGKSGPLIVVCCVILLSNLLSNFFKYFTVRIMQQAKREVTQSLRQVLYDKIIKMEVSYFSNERKGDILTKFTFDIMNIEQMVADTLKGFFREPIMIILNLLLLIFISWKLTIIAALILPIGGTFIALITKRLRKQAKAISDTNGSMLSITEESITGLRVIKSFASEDFVSEKYKNVNILNGQERRRHDIRVDFSSLFSEFSGVSMAALILFVGGSMILGGSSDLKPSEFIAYLAIFSQILVPAKSLVSCISSIQKGIVAGERVFEVIDRKPTIVDTSHSKEMPQFNRAITFKQVSFKYHQNEQSPRYVLKNINLVIPKGKTVALVGPSGSGKSTLADLVSRFYDIDEGHIYFDDTEIKQIKLRSIREKIGIVAQEAVLFNDTIFNNIAFGNPTATMEDVVKAATIANAHEFIIRAEQGYDTVIGDRGNKLSGGQKQRLSIARAVLKNPEILILDEATSALDTESERLVQDALNKLMNHRTSLVIAHRLSTIQHADLIVVLSEGEIVEQGTHQQLIIKQGLYSKLVSLQSNTGII